MTETVATETESAGHPAPFGLFDTKAAAAYLRVGAATLSSLRKEPGGPAYVAIGKLVRFRQADLDAFAASKVVKAGA